MSKIKKSIVEPKWIKIKEMYEAGTNGSNRYGKNFEIDGELDKLCCEFIDLVGTLTTNFGWSCIIEDVKIDTWKERIWSLTENAGLLPEIAWRDEKEADLAIPKDNWNSTDKDEFDYDLESKEHEAYETRS
jgi:hypothetical protein